MSLDLENYKNLVSFLGSTLGSDYEIVLHWIDKNNSYYIAAIEHSEISGRNINSPITGFALDLVRKKVYKRKDFVIHYKAEANSKLIQGSTFFIKNSKEDLIGLLCINFDSGTYINMAETLLKFAPIPLSINYQQKNTNTTSEILHTNIEDVIYSIINPSLLKSDISLSQEKKIQICSKLNDRGIFQIKGAISKVAKLLKVSEPSVYRYLKIINEKKQ